MKRMRQAGLLLALLLVLCGCAPSGEDAPAAATPEAWMAPDRSVHSAQALPLSEQAKAVQRQHPELEVRHLLLDSTHLLSVARSDGRLQPLLILLHEQAANKEELLEEALPFAAQGWHCALLDLPGHGDSAADQAINSLECCVLAGEGISRTIEYFRLSPAVDTACTALLGVSMGGSAAYCYAAGGEYPLTAICCLMAAPDFTLLPPKGGVLRGKESSGTWDEAEYSAYAAAHNPMRKAEQLTSVPLFAWHGLQDQSVPADGDQALEALYLAENRVPFRFIYDEQAGHDLPAGVLDQAARFLAELLRNRRPT